MPTADLVIHPSTGAEALGLATRRALLSRGRTAVLTRSSGEADDHGRAYSLARQHGAPLLALSLGAVEEGRRAWVYVLHADGRALHQLAVEVAACVGEAPGMPRGSALPRPLLGEGGVGLVPEAVYEREALVRGAPFGGLHLELHQVPPDPSALGDRLAATIVGWLVATARGEAESLYDAAVAADPTIAEVVSPPAPVHPSAAKVSRWGAATFGPRRRGSVKASMAREALGWVSGSGLVALVGAQAVPVAQAECLLPATAWATPVLVAACAASAVTAVVVTLARMAHHARIDLEALRRGAPPDGLSR